MCELLSYYTGEAVPSKKPSQVNLHVDLLLTESITTTAQGSNQRTSTAPNLTAGVLSTLRYAVHEVQQILAYALAVLLLIQSQPLKHTPNCLYVALILAIGPKL